MNELLNKVKEETWLFTDEQINNKIIELQNMPNRYFKVNEGYVALYLYKDKGILTKEEFKSEVMNYLYLKSLDPKEEVDRVINKNMYWFYTWFDKVENNDYFHAVQWARNNMLSLLHY